MYTIIGKGFGLYGYLPAIIMNGSDLILSDEYKSNIQKRGDINKFINSIQWTKSIKEAIYLSDDIILAIPPKEQFKFLLENEKLISDKTIFLEKPIACSPKQSSILLKFLEEKKIKFNVNYSFIYLDWFKKLYNKINSLSSNFNIKINWEFKAHFIKTNVTNWKSDSQSGGGIIRFYGIHLIAILTALEYENYKIIKLKNNTKTIIFKIINVNKPEIEILINIDSNIDKFAIDIYEDSPKNKRTFVDIKDPFEKQNKKLIKLDRRVQNIRDYLIEKNNSIQNLNFNKKVVKLWCEIEKVF
tara:strand:+ start:125 stop:1024 length:900 start_codon:yes stop_codon:yes gene_type:complete